MTETGRGFVKPPSPITTATVIQAIDPRNLEISSLRSPILSFRSSILLFRLSLCLPITPLKLRSILAISARRSESSVFRSALTICRSALTNFRSPLVAGADQSSSTDGLPIDIVPLLAACGVVSGGTLPFQYISCVRDL